MTAGNILVVDTLQSSDQALFSSLQGEGYQVFRVGEKDAILDVYQREEIDLVLVSVDQKGLNGFEILSRLKSYDPQVKVILYTDHGSKEQVVKALRMGAAEFLEKPLQVEMLTSIFDQLLGLDRVDSDLQGSLRSMSLASIIQVNCEERNTGGLHLRNRGKEGRIYFKDGRVVHASLGNTIGTEAVYQLLNWEKGQFRLEMDQAPPLKTIDAGWSELVLEGLRRIDESAVSRGIDWESAGFEQQDQPESTRPDIHQRIMKAVAAVQDVEGVLVCTPEGDVHAHQGEGITRELAGLAGYILRQVKDLGSLMEATHPKWILLGGEKAKLLILQENAMLFCLQVSKRAADEMLIQNVRTTIMRYQS